MKRISIGTLVLLVLAVMLFLFRGPQFARAQDAQEVGWLEGSLLSAEGKPVPGDAVFYKIYIYDERGNYVDKTNPDSNIGGLYAFRNIK